MAAEVSPLLVVVLLLRGRRYLSVRSDVEVTRPGLWWWLSSLLLYSVVVVDGEGTKMVGPAAESKVL